MLLAPAAYSLSATDKLEHLLAKPVIGLGLIRAFQPFIAEKRLRKGLIDSLKPNQTLTPDDFIEKRFKLWNNPGTLFTRTQQTNDVTKELILMQQNYQSINLSTTIFIGCEEHHDDITQGCYLLDKKLMHSKLTVIKNAGHYLQYKNPTLISQTIIDSTFHY